jgi:hypothetical protein
MHTTVVKEKKQDRQGTYNEKLQCVRVTTVAAETQKYNLCVSELRETLNQTDKLGVAQFFMANLYRRQQ